MVINSTENSRIVKYAKLKQKKYRDLYQLFIVEEKHLIEEAEKAGLLDTLIIREGCENISDREALWVSEDVMKKLSNKVALNEGIGICRIPAEKKL